MTKAASNPRPPAGIKPGGRALWDWATAQFEFDAHEISMLIEVTRIKDRLDALHAAVGDAVLVDTVAGQKPNPALIEARQQAIALARLLAALRLPSGDEDAGRPQRRVGVRGTYTPGSTQQTRLRRVQ